MTQQYQHIEYSIEYSLGIKLIKTSPRLLKKLMANKAYFDAKRDAEMKRKLWKHPLLCPPFVKEKR